MKKTGWLWLLPVLLSFVCRGATAQDVRKPILDKDGRFYLYKGVKTGLPYIPSGFMPEEAGQMIVLDMESKRYPFAAPLPAGSPVVKSDASESNPAIKNCVSIKITWKPPLWAGIAWISGPTGGPGDGKQWWGEDDRGWYFDLRNLKKKKLVFYARGERGKERIQAKIGILTKPEKPFGDSLSFPLETKWLTLTTTYTRYERDLSNVTPQELRQICSGLVFVSNQDQQEPENKTTTQFYIGSIFFE